MPRMIRKLKNSTPSPAVVVLLCWRSLQSAINHLSHFASDQSSLDPVRANRLLDTLSNQHSLICQPTYPTCYWPALKIVLFSSLLGQCPQVQIPVPLLLVPVVVHLPPKQLASQSGSILNTCTVSHAPWAMIGIPTTFPIGAVKANIVGIRALCCYCGCG